MLKNDKKSSLWWNSILLNIWSIHCKIMKLSSSLCKRNVFFLLACTAGDFVVLAASALFSSHSPRGFATYLRTQNCQLCNLAPRVLSNWMTNKCSNCLVYVKKVPCFSFFSKALTPPDSVIFTHEWKKGGKFDLFTDNVVHVVLETTNHSPLYQRTLCISLGHRAGDTRQQPSVSRHETNALEYHSKDSGRK